MNIGNFTYKGWSLYTKEVKLRNSPKKINIYFFSKRTPKSGSKVSEEDFKKLNADVKVNSRTGLPFIKKRR